MIKSDPVTTQKEENNSSEVEQFLQAVDILRGSNFVELTPDKKAEILGALADPEQTVKQIAATA